MIRVGSTHLSLKVTRVTLPKLPVPRNTSVLKSSGVKRSSKALPMNLFFGRPSDASSTRARQQHKHTRGGEGDSLVRAARKSATDKRRGQ